MNYLKNPFILYGIIGVLLLLNVASAIYIFVFQEKCPVCNENVVVEEKISESDEELEKTNSQTIFVDIKGYVKKPGVYQVEKGAIVNDLIKLAGGLKTNGTTDNINLSKKLEDETMLVIYSKSELKKLRAEELKASTSTEIYTNDTTSIYENTSTPNIKNSNSSIESTQKKGSIININTATKEELMTLSGVGEKTAEKIIEYRTTTKFETIEDIKNVSGIGDSVFEKIKNFITV